MDHKVNIDYSKVIVGLDIGTTKVACFIGQRDEQNPGKIKILGYSKGQSEGICRGEVINIVDAANTIKNVVGEAAKNANCAVKEVYVGIAGKHVKSLTSRSDITIPRDHDIVTQEDVDHLIESQKDSLLLNPGEQIIHIMPQTYYIDGNELSPRINHVGARGRKFGANFHIVTGEEEAIRNIGRSVEMAGLKIKGVCLEPIASAEAILTPVDLQTGTAIIDIGGGTTDIAIFTKNAIRFTQVIPFAGEVITADIENGCSILSSQAETLKVKYGTCMPSDIQKDAILSIRHPNPSHSAIQISLKNLAEIIKARTEDIIKLVVLALHDSGVAEKLGGGIVLTGGGSKLQGITNLVSYKTCIETRIGYPKEHLSPDTNIENISDPIFATCIGLVLHGFKELAEEERKHGVKPNIEDVLDEPNNDVKVEDNGTDDTNDTDDTDDTDNKKDKDNDSNHGLTRRIFDKVSKWAKDILVGPDEVE